MDVGLEDLGTYGDSVSEEIRSQVDAVKQQILDGTFHVFEGPVYDQNGNEVIASGVVPTFEEINKLQLPGSGRQRLFELIIGVPSCGLQTQPTTILVHGVYLMKYDLLLKNTMILNPDGNITEGQYLAIKDRRIARITSDVVPDSMAAQVLDCTGKLTMPGMVDGHTAYQPAASSRKTGGRVSHDLDAFFGSF